MHSNTVWCTVIQSDVFPSLMYFPVWWNCISPWISSCRLCGRWCRAECVLSGGTTRPKGSSHFALQKAAVLGTSTCIYLTAARNMGTSIYPLKSILVQKPLQRDFPNYREISPNYREISQITERFPKLQRDFPNYREISFPNYQNCISQSDQTVFQVKWEQTFTNELALSSVWAGGCSRAHPRAASAGVVRGPGCWAGGHQWAQ